MFMDITEQKKKNLIDLEEEKDGHSSLFFQKKNTADSTRQPKTESWREICKDE